jgi:hypothetical protein
MPEYILLMHSDVVDRDMANDGQAWGVYLGRLRQSGSFDGGSSVGSGQAFRKGSQARPAEGSVEGFIRVRAASLQDAQQFLSGNPNYEAGGTVEIRELPPE